MSKVGRHIFSNRIFWVAIVLVATFGLAIITQKDINAVCSNDNPLACTETGSHISSSYGNWHYDEASDTVTGEIYLKGVNWDNPGNPHGTAGVYDDGWDQYSTNGCFGWKINSYNIVINDAIIPWSAISVDSNSVPPFYMPSDSATHTISLTISTAREIIGVTNSVEVKVELRRDARMMYDTYSTWPYYRCYSGTKQAPDTDYPTDVGITITAPRPSIQGFSTVDVVGGPNSENWSAQAHNESNAWDHCGGYAGKANASFTNWLTPPSVNYDCQNLIDLGYVSTVSAVPGDTANWWFEAKNNGGVSTSDYLSTFNIYVNRSGWSADSNWKNLDDNWFSSIPATVNDAVANNFRDKSGSKNQAAINIDGYGSTGQFGCFGTGGQWGNTCQYPNGTNISSEVTGANGASGITNNTRYFKYPIQGSDAGRTLCQELNWTATKGQDGKDYNNSNRSGKACVKVEYHYPGCDIGDSACPSPDTKDNCTQKGTCPGERVKTGSGVTPVTSSDESSIQSGGTVHFNYTLSNGGPSYTLPLEYRAYAFVLKGGQDISTVSLGPRVYGISATDFTPVICGGRGVSSTQYRYCQNSVVVGSNQVIPNGGSFSPSSYNIIVSGNWDADPGDQICSYIAVNNWSVFRGVVATSVAASNIKCVEVTKSPQIQLRGSDSASGATKFGTTALTGSNINGGFVGTTSTSNAGRGSFSQYGLLTNGSINGFGSAGWTNFAGSPNTTNSCKLWFANTISAAGTCNTASLSTGGNFGTTGRVISLPTNAQATTAPSGSSGLPSGMTATAINVGNLSAANTAKTYFVNGNATITAGGTLALGSQTTLIVNGALTISDKISTPTTNFANLGQIPTLTIIANRINISSGVTNLYGTYIARGGSATEAPSGQNTINAFYSCVTIGNPSGYTANASTNYADLKNDGSCAKQLRIDGALVTRNAPRFQRTIGGGKDVNTTAAAGANLAYNEAQTTDAKTPAEIINYTPNLFLTPYYLGANSTTNAVRWKTASEIVLPARY